MTLHTAYPGVERQARAALATAPLDRDSLARPLGSCDPGRCHGACCSDGVPLDPEETAVLEALAVTEAPAFRAMGLHPQSLVAVAEAGGVGHTGIRARDAQERSPEHPAAVPDTACALLLRDGRCGLQVLAGERGLHPWHWKPMRCWLHPLVADAEGIRLPLHGISRERAFRDGGYATVTECSRGADGAPPASQVLAPELTFLGAIIGRALT